MRYLQLLCAGLAIACTSSRQGTTTVQPSDTVIALERAALDRWGNGDPQGYLETYAEEITYFDPSAPKRVDGIAAMRQLLLPITGQVDVERYDMIDPKVQWHGDVAVLTYNLASDWRRPTGERGTARWNATAVYARIDGGWRMVHNHWSFTQPALRPPGGP